MLRGGLALKMLCLEKEISNNRPHIVWFHWYEMSWVDKSMAIQSRLVVSRDRPGNGEKWERPLMEWGFSFKGWTCPKSHCGVHRTTLSILKSIGSLVYFKWVHCVVCKYLNKAVNNSYEYESKVTLNLSRQWAGRIRHIEYIKKWQWGKSENLENA